MNDYEAKQEAKRDRLENASDRAKGDAMARFEASRRAVEHIPMGQPILVGHHSERRHRSDLARSDSNMRKSIEADERAKELAHKAAAVGTGGVSSDDPDAIAKLERDLSLLELAHVAMKAANKTKKGAFEGFYLTNSSANIRRVKGRIEELKAKASKPAREPVEGQGWRIVEDLDINRVCVEFDTIPSEAIRAELKSHGFHWNRGRDAWTRMISEQAWYWANRAVQS